MDLRTLRILGAVLTPALLALCVTLVRSPDSTPAPAQHAGAAAAAPRAAATAARKATPPTKTADAVPRIERIAAGYPNRPYAIRGAVYKPKNSDVPLREVGVASWYGVPFHGRPTSTGERYNMHAMTAAHPTMPLPSYARVRNLANGRSVIVKINDRGPFYGKRIIDLSYAAARKLHITGTAKVEVVRLTHDEIRSGAWRDAVKKGAPKPPVQAQPAAPAKPGVLVARRDEVPVRMASK
jgi:rare lipoprotein A